MYNFNNKISPKSEFRQKIFNEFIHFGYSAARIREYKLLRETEIANFGDGKFKNTDIKAELENLLTAFTVKAYFKDVNLSFKISGEGQGYFLYEKFEYSICKILEDAIKSSVNNEIKLNLKIYKNKIRLNLYYAGEPIKNLSKNVSVFSARKKIAVIHTQNFVPTVKTSAKPKTVVEYLVDRLSDVNICLIDF